MSARKNNLVWLALILLLAIGLRFYQITRADVYTDESILGFRAVGLIDYAAAYNQTTPWQWYETVPQWAHLSFHDHPLGFFWSQHISISVFGENTWALRLPTVLFGLGSLLLIFFISKQFFDKKTAYLATLLLAVQPYHVWISRIGLQDSQVIFFMLLSLWLWLLAWQKNKLWLWLVWGAVLGLAIMTKYTALIMILIFIAQAIIFKFNF